VYLVRVDPVGSNNAISQGRGELGFEAINRMELGNCRGKPPGISDHTRTRTRTGGYGFDCGYDNLRPLPAPVEGLPAGTSAGI